MFNSVSGYRFISQSWEGDVAQWLITSNSPGFDPGIHWLWGGSDELVLNYINTKWPAGPELAATKNSHRWKNYSTLSFEKPLIPISKYLHISWSMSMTLHLIHSKFPYIGRKFPWTFLSVYFPYVTYLWDPVCLHRLEWGPRPTSLHTAAPVCI